MSNKTTIKTDDKVGVNMNTKSNKIDNINEIIIDIDTSPINIITEKELSDNESVSLNKMSDTDIIKVPSNAIDNQNIKSFVDSLILEVIHDTSYKLTPSKNTTVTNGTGVLKTATIKTSNKFIQACEEKRQAKEKAETQRINNANIDFPYKRAQLLTDAEIQLYHFMCNNLDNKERIVIFSKVRLADLANLDTTITTDNKYLWKITNKHVDFVICDKNTLDVICVVELDDFTHESEEAKNRDLFVMEVLHTVGIKTIRIRCKISTICKEDLVMVDEKINEVYAPNCPWCGFKMRPNKNMRTGHRFYSCPNYLNRCRYTQDID